MPPRKKIDQQQVIKLAFQILREEGYEAISARRLAKELGCSTQPIYCLFENMGELKEMLYKKGCLYFDQMVHQHVVGKEEAFLELGLGYILSAKKESNLFQFMTATHNYSLESIKDLVKNAKMPTEDKKLLLNMWLYAHGIASIVSGNEVGSSEEEIKELLVEACVCFQKNKQIV